MLKQIKRASLHAAKSVGLMQQVQESEWRRRRLLILCYHGVSLDDEHRWKPPLYVSSADLDARFAVLKAGGFAVLPLDEALHRLYRRDLPPRSVVITFDDGYHDFHVGAYPLLQKYGYPATVYLTTLRCDRNYPVFGLICSYILWKGRHQQLDLSPLLGLPARIDLSTGGERRRAERAVRAFALERRLSVPGKTELAERLAEQLGIDYHAIASRRMLTIMTPGQVSELAAKGVDFQLHTHSHRTPSTRDLFQKEIRQNQHRIAEITGTTAVHFCYPSGIHEPAFLGWLAEEGVVSATTCDSGLASPASSPLLLPRLVDHGGLAPIEFEGWLSGVAAVTARRRPFPAEAS